MIYKLGILVLVAAVVGLSASFIIGSSGEPSSGSTTSSVLGITITESINSLAPDGCGNLVKNETSNGYEVETYLSSNSVIMGSSLCIDVAVMNLNGTQLTVGTGSDLAISYNVTSSSGLLVYQTSCSPSTPPVSSSSAALSHPLNGLTCSGIWNTSASVKGSVPAAGTYQISVIASVPQANGRGISTVAYSSSITLSTA